MRQHGRAFTRLEQSTVTRAGRACSSEGAARCPQRYPERAIFCVIENGFDESSFETCTPSGSLTTRQADAGSQRLVIHPNAIRGLFAALATCATNAACRAAGGCAQRSRRVAASVDRKFRLDGLVDLAPPILT